MNIKTKMPESLKPFFDNELLQAMVYWRTRDYLNCWNHLERAHILGQLYPYQHSLVHWKMMVFGIRTKNFKEIIGQIPRLLFGGVKSFVGEIPIGNTGGSNVSPLRSMEIPQDLKRIIDLNKD